MDPKESCWVSVRSLTWLVGYKDKTFSQILLVPKVLAYFLASNLPQCLKIFWVRTDKPSVLTALMSSISRPSPINIQKPTHTPLLFHVFHLTHLHNQGLYRTPWFLLLALEGQPEKEVSVPAFAQYLQQA